LTGIGTKTGKFYVFMYKEKSSLDIRRAWRHRRILRGYIERAHRRDRKVENVSIVVCQSSAKCVILWI
jgi:hypothetical protein